MIGTRILAADEWPHLKEQTELPKLLSYVRPEDADVVVVEDEGRVIGSLAVMRATHFEGLWIDPERKGKAGVARSLMRQAIALARVRDEKWVFGGAADDRMRSLLGRLGGVQMPLDFYALWVGRPECRQQ